MSKKKDHGKITLGMLKGKPVTTSVPSISIKFHANAEQIEELYASEDETNDISDKNEKEKLPLLSSSPSTIGDTDSSPLRYFPRLAKRSTSVDVSQGHQDASPPSDPWRFFSDIKGKITKSVEEKITDFKARNQDEGSPHHKQKSDLKTIRDSKENSSVSDSEELSESSISKTCGIVSTTEGVEMSSDDDTPSIEKDTKEVENKLPTSALSQKFRLFKNTTLVKEGDVKVNDLSKLYNINAEKVEQVLPEDSEDVESAVDALEETDLKIDEGEKKVVNKEDILKCVAQKFDNIELDSNEMLNVKEVTGKEIRASFLEGAGMTTVFAPTGFVDLRPVPARNRPISTYMSMAVLLLSVVLYLCVHYYSLFLAGLAAGIILAYICLQIYIKLSPPIGIKATSPANSPLAINKIIEMQAIKEYQPLSKYEGWVNEYPNVYNPSTYHISQTQAVYLRLQGNLLRISHSKHKVPKRAMWNEPDIKMNFSHHRIYNLLGAKVNLLPEGLARKRFWSKKYPICVSLSKEQMSFVADGVIKGEDEEEKEDKQSDKSSSLEKDKSSSLEKDKNKAAVPKDKKVFARFRRREYPVLAQRFSKLTEDEECELESDSRASTPSADISDVAVEDSVSPVEEDLINTNDQNEEDFNSLPDDWSLCSPPLTQESPTGIKIYIFGRTDREKEDWFRRLCAATHKGVGVGIAVKDLDDIDLKETISETLIEAAHTELEYLKYMSVFKALKKQSTQTKTDTTQQEIVSEPKSDLLWLNALIGRVLFDCMRDPTFTLRVRERIQRKLCTIKLPYFIEELLIPELSLGKTPPFIHRTNKPVLDERGLWIDLDITYEGMIVLTLQTKLNLMRLKNPQAYEKPTGLEKSAIYNSDVDDSAESSSDEEGNNDVPNPSQDSNTSSNSSKKFIKMVDKIAESKFFQKATELRYIKKAMEGVSNTDLRLTVEVKAIVGTLVLNIPPPPSDRIWVGFRPVPEIMISARPVVGERNISYIMVTSWIEKKLLQEFQKVMVIPNMEDFVIPVMNSRLPD